MCRCGLSCDYIYRALEHAESEGTGYRLSVGMLFPEEEINDTEIPEKEPVPP